ncbi:MAG: nucleotidyltransferase family protein, partial [Planctomycetota bacterium]|jgi:hypothetical protein
VFREDFFPRYYYEIEYTAGSVDPVLIDLHVRPFRLLRYARLLPDEAIWERAVPVRMGSATVYVPSAENMLLHLAVHSAIHGNGRGLWLHDIKRWAEARGDALDWDRLVDAAGRWRLARAVLSGFRATGAAPGPVCSPSVCDRLARMPANWRDRLALWHAPLDGGNLVVSFLVSVPSWCPTAPTWTSGAHDMTAGIGAGPMSVGASPRSCGACPASRASPRRSKCAKAPSMASGSSPGASSRGAR